MLPEEEKRRLLYRRQYLITPEAVNCPFLHQTLAIDHNYKLYAHLDLLVTDHVAESCRLILLGDIFDFRNPHFGNAQILEQLADADFTSFLQKVSWYAGRFVIIYLNKTGIFLITDAASARKIYYYCKGEYVYCASQPHLLARILNLQLTTNPTKIRFYNSERHEKLNNANIGNTTRYDDVFQLIPNHYLAIRSFKIERFWPDKPIEKRALSQVVNQCADMIEGYMKSIGNRYKIMLPVTAGKDSRLLFSATRTMFDKVFYYINKEKYLKDDSYDITIPGSLLKKLGVSFHVIDPYGPVDKDFEDIYFANNPYASQKYLPLIYNYYKNFSDRVNLPGIFINIIEDIYEFYGSELQAKDLVKFIHIEEFDYATEYMQKWLNESLAACRKNNLSVLNLLYWEERMANWGTQIQLDKDIAQEDFVPYNSRMLIEILLSADMKYRGKPHFRIFKDIMRVLYPATLQAPFNPGFKDKVLKLSESLGIIKPVKKIYYSYIKNRLRIA